MSPPNPVQFHWCRPKQAFQLPEVDPRKGIRIIVLMRNQGGFQPDQGRSCSPRRVAGVLSGCILGDPLRLQILGYRIGFAAMLTV